MLSETLFVLAFLRYLFNLTTGAGVEDRSHGAARQRSTMGASCAPRA